MWKSFCAAIILFFSTPLTAWAAADCVPVGKWLAPASGTTIPAKHLIRRMAARPVVLLAETHDSAEDHRWQLQTLAALHLQNPNLVLGFEAFPRTSQPVLDRWIRGDLSERQFLKQSRWKEVWGFDARLYLPLFHFARQNRIPMIALNVGRDFISRVRKSGFDAIPAGERRGLTKPAPVSAAYKKYLERVFAEHQKQRKQKAEQGKAKSEKAAGMPESQNLERFIEVQSTWDRAMAQALADARNAGGKPVVVGIVGGGHADYGFGIVEQLASLGIQNGAVLAAWGQDRSCEQLKGEDGRAVADAVFGIAELPEPPKPHRPKLGIMIAPTKGGVRISSVLKDSIAEESGLRKGDIIIGVAGTSVASTGELISAIHRQAPGTWLPLRVKRGKETVEIVAKFPSRR